MALHKQEQPERGFDYERAYRELSAKMRTLHISRIAEMPRIELYLDQVLSIIGTELSFMYQEDERIVTGAMVNNYVKQRLVPAPTRKRYTRRHLGTLIFVCAFKRVLSIAQIAQIVQMVGEADIDVERAYDASIACLEHALALLFPEEPDGQPELSTIHIELMDSAGNRCEPRLEILLENVVLLLACKVYADHMLALEARRVAAAE